MAFGRFSLDQKIHKELVEAAPKIRQAEWAKLLAWVPVVEGMKRWTSTVLLAIVAAGSRGIRVRVLSNLLEIPINHMRARLVILEEFELVSTYYSDGIIHFRQRLAEVDWPSWVIPPTWALEEVPTKSTIKPSKSLYTVTDGKVHQARRKLANLVKYGVHRLASVTDYHTKQAMEAESQEKTRTGTFGTSTEEIQDFDTGFKSGEPQDKPQTGSLVTKGVRLQKSANGSKSKKRKDKTQTRTLPTRSVTNERVNGDTLGGIRVPGNHSTSDNLAGENLGTRHNKVFIEEKDSQGGSSTGQLGGGQSQALLDMVSEDDTRRVSQVRVAPSRRREVQGWQSKSREDWYGLDLLGYFLHRWRKFYGEEDPSFVGEPFSLKDRENVFRKANYRLQSFDKRFFRAKGDGAAYLDWIFDAFLPNSDWFKDVLMFTQAFKLSPNNFLYARFLQRGVKTKSGPSGKKGKWHHWGFEEG